MSKVVCMKLKVMPNQLESWVLPSSLADRGATNAITGIADAMSDSVPLWSLQVRWREQDGRMPFRRQTLWELPCQSLSTITKFVRQLIFRVSLRKLSISQLQVDQGQLSLTYLKTYLLWKPTSSIHQNEPTKLSTDS